MQEMLFQNKLDKELPERAAEKELQDSKARMAADIQDIEVIRKWHDSTIQSRMLEWQKREMASRQESLFEGEILFCDEKQNKEQALVNIVDTKESLVTAWYEGKQGLTRVSFRCNLKGTLRYMRFGFYSDDMAEKVRAQYLRGRHEYEAHIGVALHAIRTKGQLPTNVLKIIKQSMPDYFEHLKQEQERIEQAPRW